MPPPLKLVTATVAEPAPVREFADAMSRLASGVVLVTCRVGDRPWGMTVTAFTSVAADPPTVLVSLGSETASARAIAASRSFGVSILAEEQLAVARYGSAPAVAKFLEPFSEAGDDWSTSPVVAEALAHLDCKLTEVVQVADHTVFFGRVRSARATGGGPPLLYHDRGYRTLASPGRVNASNGRNASWLSS